MNRVYTSEVRNVNEALRKLVHLGRQPHLWRTISPRGMDTLEFRGVFITDYSHPVERVLFSPVRDANPFFHLMEALWIMDGRDDVAFLNQFNSNIGTFSDDGKTFNAPYGYRLRQHFRQPVHGENHAYEYDPVSRAIIGFQPLDQLAEVIELLKREPDTRRAVLCLWDPLKDLNKDSKDIPCNDLVCFKIREDTLDMTVMNRSNDAMWGAYGANAVQFSFLQEFVACALHVRVGHYRQISDSFHVYTSQATWQKCCRFSETSSFDDPYVDQFGRANFHLVPLMPRWVHYHGERPAWKIWLDQNHAFLNDELGTYDARDNGVPIPIMPFFHSVAVPVMTAWRIYKDATGELGDKNARITLAQKHLLERCTGQDWLTACVQWLERRRKSADAETVQKARSET